MNKNIGNVERVVRIIAGIAILSLIFFLEGDSRWWGLIGAVPLTTGLLGWCPPYALLGISTCSARSDESSA